MEGGKSGGDLSFGLPNYDLKRDGRTITVSGTYHFSQYLPVSWHEQGTVIDYLSGTNPSIPKPFSTQVTIDYSQAEIMVPKLSNFPASSSY